MTTHRDGRGPTSGRDGRGVESAIGVTGLRGGIGRSGRRQRQVAACSRRSGGGAGGVGIGAGGREVGRKMLKVLMRRGVRGCWIGLTERVLAADAELFEQEGGLRDFFGVLKGFEHGRGLTQLHRGEVIDHHVGLARGPCTAAPWPWPAWRGAARGSAPLGGNPRPASRRNAAAPSRQTRPAGLRSSASWSAISFLSCSSRRRIASVSAWRRSRRWRSISSASKFFISRSCSVCGTVGHAFETQQLIAGGGRLGLGGLGGGRGPGPPRLASDETYRPPLHPVIIQPLAGACSQPTNPTGGGQVQQHQNENAASSDFTRTLRSLGITRPRLDQQTASRVYACDASSSSSAVSRRFCCSCQASSGLCSRSSSKALRCWVRFEQCCRAACPGFQFREASDQLPTAHGGLGVEAGEVADAAEVDAADQRRAEVALGSGRCPLHLRELIRQDHAGADALGESRAGLVFESVSVLQQGLVAEDKGHDSLRGQENFTAGNGGGGGTLTGCGGWGACGVTGVVAASDRAGRRGPGVGRWSGRISPGPALRPGPAGADDRSRACR